MNGLQRYLRLGIGLLGLAFSAFIVFIMTRGFLLNKQGMREDLPSTYVLTSEDSSLFADRYLPHLKMLEVYNSKVRHSISALDLDSTYTLFTFKFDLKNPISISTLTREAYESNGRSINYSYRLIHNNPLYKFYHRNGSLGAIGEMYLAFKGSFKVLLATDSLKYYSGQVDHFSTRYGASASVDISMEAQNEFLKGYLPQVQILLIKHHGFLHLLVLVPGHPETIIPDHLLLDIINNKTNFG